MGNRFVDGLLFYRMIASGAANLKERAETVNALNVFPVPDGDTGSNMSRTIDAGLAALAEQKPAQIGEAAKHLSSGLLMGARGNSGVILSQLFRGFAQALDGLTRAGTVQFAEAMQKGVETAYKAVIKPVEGTILTVAKDAAEAGVSAVDRFDNLETWLEHVCDAMERSLKRTPDLLPILKKVGVVDSGGQGLLFIYEGMLAALKGDGQAPIAPSVPSHMNEKTDTRLLSEALSQDASSQTTGAQAKIRPEEIDFIYDMEFFIRLTAKCDGEGAAETLRNKLADVGDSVLVIHDDERIKVHVHANEPGNILNEALRHGELTDIHIQNMRDQHREAARVDAGSSKRIGLVAVAAGEGLADIFTSLGADVVLSGGQSMIRAQRISSARWKRPAQSAYSFSQTIRTSC